MPFRKQCSAEKTRTAQKMRLHPTPAEASLWERFLERPYGLKFRRQEVILGWIADFYCSAKRLVIEVDGGYHDSPEQRARDAHRDRVMASYGLGVMRFTNEEVLRRPEVVLEQISLWKNTLPRKTRIRPASTVAKKRRAA